MPANIATLPDINFAPQSAQEIEASIITHYEKAAGLTLQPGSPERLFLESLAYFVAVQNANINFAGRQNLLAYATGGHLDHIGLMMGVERLAAQPGRCILKFEIGEPQPFDVPIPAGTRVTTRDGKIVFATAQMAVILPGQTSTEAIAFSEGAGEAVNGLLPGQLGQLVDPLPYIMAAENVTTTTGGADTETDERLRERIRIAPESFTVAGSVGAYKARTLAISQEIEEVSVWSPEPGVVDVRFTLTGGELPDAAMIRIVKEGLSADTVRPLTDLVLAGAPEVVEYEISGYWFLGRSKAALLASVAAAVEKAVGEFRLWQRSKPGRDINPSRLISLIEQAGAKRISLENPQFTPLNVIQIARETAIDLKFGGLEDD